MSKKLTNEEIIKYAKMIDISIKDDELNWIARKINNAYHSTNELDYIDTLEDIEPSIEESIHKLREDEPIKYNEDEILSCSENKEGDYIVIKK